MAKNKRLIIQPKVGKNQFTKFVNQLESEGVTMIYADPNSISNKKSKIQTVYSSTNAKYVVLDKEKVSKIKGKKIGRKFKVLSNKDIDNILESAKKGLDFVIIEVKDWKIIPLENIIAKLHKIHTEIFTVAKNVKEVRKMFSILAVSYTHLTLPTKA